MKKGKLNLKKTNTTFWQIEPEENKVMFNNKNITKAWSTVHFTTLNFIYSNEADKLVNVQLMS